MQDWTPDFIPKVLEDAPMAELMEELFPIPGPRRRHRHRQSARSLTTIGT